MEIKKKYIITGLIILILIMLVMIVINILPKQNKKSEESEFLQMSPDFRHDVSKYLSESENATSMNDEVIIAKNCYKFFEKYYNKISAKEIQENWDNFARNIVLKYSENIKSENEIDDYFENNSEEIYLETGIENYDEFYNMIISILDNSNSKKLKLESLEILEPITVDENYTYAKLKATYKGNININFNMKVFNEKNDNGLFIVYY